MKKTISLLLAMWLPLFGTLPVLADMSGLSAQDAAAASDAQRQQMEMLRIREKDPMLIPGALIVVEFKGERYVVRVNNAHQLELRGVGTIDVKNKRVSEIENQVLRNTGFNVKLAVEQVYPSVNVLGAVYQQRKVYPDYLQGIIADCGGLDSDKTNYRVSVFDPEANRTSYYDVKEILEGKKIVWVNPGSTVNFQVSGARQAEAQIRPPLRIILDVIQTGAIVGGAIAIADRR